MATDPLASEFGQQMDVHDVGTSSKDGWEETSIWCVLCGQRRTMGRFVPEQGELVLRCPTCCHEPGDTLTKNIFPDLLSSVKEYKPALRRLLTWCHSYYRSAIQLGVAPCINCGHTTTLTRILPEDASSWLRHRNGHIFCISCAFCHSTSFSCLEILVLGHPEGRQFWQKHPRIRTLPQHYIEEADGRAAIVTSFQSVTDSARLDVVSACDTYEVICTYGSQL